MLIVAAAGCGDDPRSRPDGGATGPPASPPSRLDAAPPSPRFEADAIPPDAHAPDARPTDATPPASIADCPAACDRFAACEQLDDVFGDEFACLAACARAAGVDTDPPQAAWFACLDAVDCSRLRECALPAAPVRNCDEACAVASACGLDAPLPRCAEACAELPEARRAAFAQCAGAVDARRCDRDALLGCLGSEVFDDCNTRCARTSTCDLESGPDCLPRCIAARTAQDPLARLHAADIDRCAATAPEDCSAVAACLATGGDRPGLRGTDCPEICAALGPCEFAFAPPCNETCARAFDEDRPGAIDYVECMLNAVAAQQCDPHVVGECARFAGRGGDSAPACAALCRATFACGIADAPDAATCAAACAAAAAPRRPEHLAQRGRLECAWALDCAELASCLDATDPARICAPQLAGCLADAVRRQRSAGCGPLAACVGVEPPASSAACDALCDRRRTCDIELDAFTCARSCTPSPPGLDAQVACAEVTACHQLDACLDLDADVPDDCVEICASAGGCGGVFADPVACPVFCAGWSASPAARFEDVGETAECIAALTADGACPLDEALACFSGRAR